MIYDVPLIIRGNVISEMAVEYPARGAGVTIRTPRIADHVSQLVLSRSSALSDLYELKFSDILDYIDALGKELVLEKNAYLQEAAELSMLVSGLSRDVVKTFFENIASFYNSTYVRHLADSTIGTDFLEGWVGRTLSNGRTAQVRAFGARTVYMLSGNVPIPSAMGVIRNAFTRGDAIFKAPSNDPLTGVAIARTMIAMAPDHPVTKHLSVAYWKGGDASVEATVYNPKYTEKVLAWGGVDSVMHVRKYMQPGIDLITMDPKLSSSIVGAAAFVDDRTMAAVAHRVAMDIGLYNQQACASARVIYIETGTDPAGLAQANRFGQMVYDAIQALPARLSGPAAQLAAGLVDELHALRYMGDDHVVYGGDRNGGVIVSQGPDPVDFAKLLDGRVANLVPVDDMDVPIRSVTAYTQTIGVFPDDLKAELRDRLVFNGAQRLVSLGYALKANMAGPNDGIEPIRRMVKWISDETSDPDIVSFDPFRGAD